MAFTLRSQFNIVKVNLKTIKERNFTLAFYNNLQGDSP